MEDAFRESLKSNVSQRKLRNEWNRKFLTVCGRCRRRISTTCRASASHCGKDVSMELATRFYMWTKERREKEKEKKLLV